MKARIAVLALLLLAIGAAVTARPAYAEETTCRGTLGAVTVDNLRVPQGGSCTLKGTRVEGTVKVENRATLRASNIAVKGNIQAEGAANVVVSNSTVGGSVQIVQGGAASIDGTRINGDILFDSNSKKLAAGRNFVGGNIQAFQNTGGVAISRNTVDGNLQCKANKPAPTGGGNIVYGSKEDQCARL
jgi:hypothetical protein